MLQRYVTACAGRGAYPIKFNGSIFVVDDPTRINNKTNQPSPVNADYRDWGGGYWYQNTRAMYWPRLEAGDYDEMLPLFKMYYDQMERNRSLIKAYYGHDGSYFDEMQHFWSKLRYSGREMPPNWNDKYFTDILDMGMMMLDYYEYTGDTKFAREMAIPMITDGLTFFNEHFYLGPDGKLLLDNDNAIEMYWKATDPAPDIAGLHAILPRMIALPDDLVDAKTRAGWVKMLSILPDLPRGTKNGQGRAVALSRTADDDGEERRKPGALRDLSVPPLWPRKTSPRSRHPHFLRPPVQTEGLLGAGSRPIRHAGVDGCGGRLCPL